MKQTSTSGSNCAIGIASLDARLRQGRIPLRAVWIRKPEMVVLEMESLAGRQAII
jgi:hypothetical protein